jgi:DNA-binding MarR family transcriptional regulator
MGVDVNVYNSVYTNTPSTWGAANNADDPSSNSSVGRDLTFGGNMDETRTKTDLTMSEGGQLFSLLGTTYNAMLRARKKELGPAGVSLRQFMALWGLKVMGRPTTIAELSQIIDRDHQTTAQLLKRMEKEGFLKRRKGPHKRSPINVVLTAKGEDVFGLADQRSEVFDEISACLSPNERETLTVLLRRLREEAVAKSALYPPLPGPLASLLGM